MEIAAIIFIVFAIIVITLATGANGSGARYRAGVWFRKNKVKNKGFELPRPPPPPPPGWVEENKKTYLGSMKGKRGIILPGYNPVFRVYNEDHTFIDYTISHPDMEIEILDDDVRAYKRNGQYFIDVTPESLGKSK